MVCPKCGSDNTQRLEVVYESGLFMVNTKSTTSGLENSSVFGMCTHTKELLKLPYLKSI